MAITCPILSALAALSDTPHPLYVACSGGRDSLVLAYGCLLLHHQGVLKQLPTLLHVHHGMQQANDGWAAFVGEWAKRWGFDCHILWLQLNKNTETQARAARYQALSEMMSDDGVLLVAHHADDQAETVLMRLIHGAGVQGLSGMRMWQVKEIKGRAITIYRPLLEVSRQTITAFAHAHDLPYVDDPTNEMMDNARSLIRNDILPRLAMLNPKVKDNIARTAHLMDDANKLIMEVTHELHQACKVNGANQPFVMKLDITKVHVLTPSKQSALIRHYVQADESLPPSHQIITDVMHLIHRTDGDHQTQLFWQGVDGIYVLCRYQEVLYRYHQALFLLLKTEKIDDGLTDEIRVRGDKVLLKEGDALRLVFCVDKFWQLLKGEADQRFIENLRLQELSLKVVGTSDEVMIYQPYINKAGQLQIAFQRLRGKKLYQTLKIPTWHRKNLWMLCMNQQPVLLMTMDECWLLEGTYFEVFMKNLDGRRHELIEVMITRSSAS